MSTNLKGQVFSGVVWNGIARIGQQVIQFGLSVILARLLLPADFGAVGMITVVTTFMAMFAEAGFASALVQRTHISELHTDSVFWFSMVSGLVLSCLLFAGAPLVAAFYHEPILSPMTRGLSPIFFLSSAGLVPAALMQRRLQFHLLARISLVATFASGVTGVTLALLGAGVWSLVVMNLTSFLVVTVLNLLFSRWHPGRGLSLGALKELWDFTGNVLGFNFVNYWARNADNMLVGRFLGSAALGYYSRAYGLMLMPITQIISVVSNVMFAALSTIKEDKVRVKRIYLRALGLISFLAFPMMVGLLILAEPFVLALFGEPWADMILVLRILAMVGLLQSLVNPTGWLYLSQGRTDWYFRWGLVNATVVVVAIAGGTALGSIEAVAVCYAVANLLLWYPSLSIPGRLVGIQVKDVLRAVTGALVDSLVMGLAVCGIGWLLPDSIDDWLELALLTATGVLVYGALTIGLRRQAWLELAALLRERLSRRGEAAALPGSVDSEEGCGSIGCDRDSGCIGCDSLP
jgi:O-antigen/teichoic acid export membrane protein